MFFQSRVNFFADLLDYEQPRCQLSAVVSLYSKSVRELSRVVGSASIRQACHVDTLSHKRNRYFRSLQAIKHTVHLTLSQPLREVYVMNLLYYY